MLLLQSAITLDEQISMYKMAMKSNYKCLLIPPFTINSITELWQILKLEVDFLQSFLKLLRLLRWQCL